MKKKIKIIIPLAVLSVGCGVLAACGGSVDYTYPNYSYHNPDRSEEPLEKDEGVTLDGKLDEDFWKEASRNWLEVTKATDDAVTLRTTSYFGEKGLYMAFDVDDPFVYVNPERDTYNNSGIELYIATSENARENAYEIDLNPDGRTRITLCNATGAMSTWYEQYEFAATPKDGEINSFDCTGYVIEAFFPYRMFGGEAHDFYYTDIAVISTVDETSTDREWYPFAQKEYGGSWMNPTSWFRFDENGLVGGRKVALAEGSEHVTLKSNSMVVDRFGYNLQLKAESGYAITKVFVNEKEVTEKLLDTNYGVTYSLKSVKEDITVRVETEAVAAGNKSLTGTLKLHRNGEETLADSSAEIALKNADGETVSGVALNANGTFAAENLSQGIYTFTATKSGYAPVSRLINVNRDRNIAIVMEAESIFADSARWDLSDENDGVVTFKYGDGTPLFMAEGQSDFVFGFTVKPTEQELQKKVDLRYGIRMAFQSEEGKLAGKYLEYDLIRKGGSERWQIQIPNHNNGGVITNWPEPYTLTNSQVDKLLKEGLEIVAARTGESFYLYVNGVKVDTRTVEDAESVKVCPGFVHYGNNVFVDFAYRFESEYNSSEWDKVTVTVDDTAKGGTLSLDKQEYTAGENIVISATPSSGYVLIDILVNGYSYANEITNDDKLTVKIDASKIEITPVLIEITPVFVAETEKVESKIVNFPNAEGLQIRLTRGGNYVENTEKTVNSGKVEFTQIAVGRYRIQVKAFGLWGDTNQILTVNGREAESTITIENAATLISGNWEIANNNAQLEASVGGLAIGDGWFVTKISGLTASQFASGDVRFGFRIDYEGAVGRNYTLNANNGNWKFQVMDDWKEIGLSDTAFAKDWLKNGTPFYLAVNRNAQSGKVDVYMGTSATNLIKVGTPEAHQIGKNITRFGLWKSGGAFDVTFSDTKFGTTAAEAFGYAANTEISVTNNALESDKTTNHGAIKVEGSFGNAVTLTIETDTSNSAKHYICTSVQVNGVERLGDFQNETLTLTQMYLSDTLTIEATFAEAQKYTYAGTAQYFDAGKWKSFAENTELVFTDSTAVATKVTVGANGQFATELYTGAYTLTVTSGKNYVLNIANVTIGEEAQSGIAIKAVERVFALKDFENKDNANTQYNFEEVVAQNTPVTKTVNGKEIVFNGTLAPNRAHNGSVIGNASLNAFAQGNFSVGVFVKLPENFTNASGEQRIVAPGVRFMNNKTFAPFLYENGDTWKLQVTAWYNSLVTNWWECTLNADQVTALKTTGIYIELIRMGNVYHWAIDGTVVRTDTIDETPQDFMFIRGAEGSVTLQEIAYRIAPCDSIAGYAYQNNGVLLAEITGSQDFETTLLVQVPEASKDDYRMGWKLTVNGKEWHFGITKSNGTQAKLQLTDWSKWEDRFWFPNSGHDDWYNTLFTDGITLKMKKETVEGVVKLTFYINDELIYTFGSNSGDNSNIGINFSSATIKLEVEVNNSGNPYGADGAVQNRAYTFKYL